MTFVHHVSMKMFRAVHSTFRIFRGGKRHVEERCTRAQRSFYQGLALWWAACLIVHLSPFVAAAQAPPPASQQTTALEDADAVFQHLALFSEVLARVKQNYADNPKAKELVEGAIRGMLQTLDPYSQYYDVKAYQELQTDTSGKFGGLGMYIGIKQNRLTVIAPIEGTPAFRTGIMTGDVISDIDGVSTAGMSADDAASKMRGEPGTSVTLTILREGANEPLVLTITRDIITVRSVKFSRLQDNIGYIRITQFVESTAESVGEAIAALTQQGIKGLILDLRSNPGGLLSSAVNVAGHFLKEGDLVVYTKGREEREDFRASSKEGRTDLPLVVLVNQGSASASEIVAGALRAHHRAIVMGARTFGKASVQKIYPLREGNETAAVKLTVAHYFTPDDVDIHRVGIVPDVELASLSPLEARMWRKVRPGEALKTFLADEKEGVLQRLLALKPGETTSSLYRKYQMLLDALERENVVLSENLIRLAIAHETLDESDDYEYDPQVQAAIQYLRAFEVFRGLKTKNEE